MPSALDAFNVTWNQARATFGEGTPVDGSQYDDSRRFLDMQGTVRSAAPDSHWTGAASEHYAETNARYAQDFSRMAALDRRLGAVVSWSADVVDTGRRDLEAVRQWVNDASARLPRSTAGDRVLWSLVSAGNAAIAAIIERSHGELTAITGRLEDIGREWDELGSSS
ncbi:MAG: EspA/EspE family type VII secretion system effector [Mycobacterium sp.]|nr:EspA/EspE family type VII secretion system effector [Mycobacterium sp.]